MIGFYSSQWTNPWGASEELWSQAALLLQQRGHSITVNYQRWSTCPARLAEIQQGGGAMFWRQQPKSQTSTQSSTSSQLNGLTDIYSSEYWLETVKPQFVIITLGWHLDDLSVARACLKRHIPYVINIRTANKIHWITDENIDDLREVFTKATACFFITPHNRDIMETQLALTLPHVRFAPSPVAVSYDACPSWFEMKSQWRLACVGRLHLPSKGQDLILNLLRSDKWRQRPIQVRFWGTHQNHQKQLQELVKLYKLHEQVKFCGFARDIEKLWAEHHALLLPSRYEGGMPLVTVEAMLCGRIPIVTKCAGQLVNDNETGFVAAAPTVELLDEALERAWGQRTKWQAMGQLAARQIREKYPRHPVDDFTMQIETLVKETS